MVFILDNYDSFTYNLAQYLGELGETVEVRRNDQVTLADIERLRPARVVISPGPCTPHVAGISISLIRHFAGKLPILGVCLGHQAIGAAFGGQVVRAPKPVHGKTSSVEHDDRGVFRGLPQPLTATRYHSTSTRWFSGSRIAASLPNASPQQKPARSYPTSSPGSTARSTAAQTPTASLP